jgi:carbon storage regulator
VLVLTRKSGEAIVLDGGIRITIVSVQGDRVRVGVEAPAEVRVDRDEVRRRVEEEELLAASR